MLKSLNVTTLNLILFQTIHSFIESCHIGLSKTAGENIGANKDIIEFTAEMVLVDLIRWLQALWLFNTEINYMNKSHDN